MVSVSAYPCVFLVRFGVGMAGGTGKFLIVGFVFMTLCALIPLAGVCSRINGKMFGIVLCKTRGRPTGIGGVAGGTIGAKLRGAVVGTYSGFKI